MVEQFGLCRALLVCLHTWFSGAYFVDTRSTKNSNSNHSSSTNSDFFRHPKPPNDVALSQIERFDVALHGGPSSACADLEGTLLRSRSPFPYLFLVAYEAGSPLRALLLLIIYALSWPLCCLLSEPASARFLAFFAFVGLPISEIPGVGRAVLSKFFLEDLSSSTYRPFLSCTGPKCIVTGFPRLAVEPFAKEYLHVDRVAGTELHVVGGYCTGLTYGVDVMKVLIGDSKGPDVCFTHRPVENPLLPHCTDAYIVMPSEEVEAVSKENLVKPLIFYDGRLAVRPTPLLCACIFLWMPFGFLLAVMRILAGVCLPVGIAVPLSALLGMRIRVRGALPLIPYEKEKEGRAGVRGMLYVCSHRTLLDPIFLTSALGRRVTAVTYSLSRLSEILSPIKTVRLTRSRTHDAKMIASLLNEGDLCMCPEGTTCREAYLLRFSSLFAELTDFIVPVAMDVSISLFHGSTARGYKAMDPFYFLMNPRPQYIVNILEPLRKEDTCAGGKSSIEVANHCQKVIADALGFQCTSLTRKDKYLMLAGNDGVVPNPPNLQRNVTGS